MLIAWSSYFNYPFVQIYVGILISEPDRCRSRIGTKAWSAPEPDQRLSRIGAYVIWLSSLYNLYLLLLYIWEASFCLLCKYDRKIPFLSAYWKPGDVKKELLKPLSSFMFSILDCLNWCVMGRILPFSIGSALPKLALFLLATVLCYGSHPAFSDR